MCWACYTSLTGGGAGAATLAGAGAGGGSIGGPAPMTESGEKKSIDPKQLAIIGVGLLVALGFGVKTMMGGEESGGDELGGAPTPVQRPNPVAAENKVPVVTVGNVAVPLPPISTNQNGGQPLPAQYFRTIVSPVPKHKWGTAAILPTNGKVSESTARSYALLAKQNIDRVHKFAALEIFVITDETAAATFRRFQNRREGAPLTEAQFKDPALAEVWGSTIVRYMWNGGRASFTSPSKNPNSFWSDPPTP